MILHGHSMNWEKEFERLAVVYRESLGDLLIRAEHVGSTSIPGIKAKPILDIDLVIRDYDVFPRVVDRLGRLDYFHNGNQGIPHREAFIRADEFTPRVDGKNEAPRRWMAHHLYVCPESSEELHRHVLFRDYLRTNADARAEYQEIKERIEARADGDRRKYADIKEEEFRPYFERILATAIRTAPTS